MQFLWVALTAISAFILGRSILIWSFVAYVVGPWALLVALLGIKKSTWENRKNVVIKFREGLEEATVPEDYKDFNTVDDLMKQLENK
jgi:hypothetical protein